MPLRARCTQTLSRSVSHNIFNVNAGRLGRCWNLYIRRDRFCSDSKQELVMDCKDCGACCLGQNIPVSAAAGDRVSHEFVDEQGCLKQVEGRCVFFDTDTRLCSTYLNRPRVCARFLPGSARCLYVRLWAEVQLDWFNPERKPVPSESQIRTAFEPVMNDQDMTVISILGMPVDLTEPAISRYNDTVRQAIYF